MTCRNNTFKYRVAAAEYLFDYCLLSKILRSVATRGGVEDEGKDLSTAAAACVCQARRHVHCRYLYNTHTHTYIIYNYVYCILMPRPSEAVYIIVWTTTFDGIVRRV